MNIRQAKSKARRTLGRVEDLLTELESAIEDVGLLASEVYDEQSTVEVALAEIENTESAAYNRLDDRLGKWTALQERLEAFKSEAEEALGTSLDDLRMTIDEFDDIV